MLKTVINYIDTHAPESIGVSLASFGISYLDVEVKEVYEIFIEILRTIILLFGALTAVLTFYAKFIKKKKNGKEKDSNSNNKASR